MPTTIKLYDFKKSQKRLEDYIEDIDNHIICYIQLRNHFKATIKQYVTLQKMNNNKKDKQERLKQSGYDNQNVFDNNKDTTNNKRRSNDRIKSSTKDDSHKFNLNIIANDKEYKSLLPLLSFHRHRDPIRQKHNDNTYNNNESSKYYNIHSSNIHLNESGNKSENKDRNHRNDNENKVITNQKVSMIINT